MVEDADASTDALLHEASEWLAYAQGTASLLAECVREDEMDRREPSLTPGGVAALVAVARLA